jgi:2-keto-3-deoxy-L-fuconate dehydrogenase
VVAADINPATLWPLCKGHAQVLDVRDRDGGGAVAAAMGPFDILFNAAGYVAHGTILDCDEDQLGLFGRSEPDGDVPRHPAVLPGMLARGGGQHHQRRLGRGVDSGRAQPLCLWRDQGRGDRADQGDRRRFRGQGHALQRDLPRHGRQPVADGRGWRRWARTLPGGTGRGAALFLARQPSGRLGTAQEIAALAVYLGRTKVPLPPAPQWSSMAAGRTPERITR